MTESLEFSSIVHQIKNLRGKFEAFEKVCGAGVIHDTRSYLNILVNWERNFEWYSSHQDEFYLHDWTTSPVGKYRPTQEQVNSYFNHIFEKAEKFLVDNVKVHTVINHGSGYPECKCEQCVWESDDY